MNFFAASNFRALNIHIEQANLAVLGVRWESFCHSTLRTKDL
jgi:hypothetical protein